MKKVAILGLILINISFAKSVVATQTCEAFNNLKHSKNSGHINLRVGQDYQVMQEQRGSYFIKVPNAHPQNRWVSQECFKKNLLSSTQKSTKKETKKAIKSNLNSALVLSWQNSFCKTHSNKKECRQGIGKDHLVLHGLWPQPRSNEYCQIDRKIEQYDRHKRWNALPSLNLDSSVVSLMKQYMPGYFSNLQRHEYYKHGSCYSQNPNEYFKDALTLTKKADETIGKFLRDNIGKKISFVNLQRYAAKTIDPSIKYKLSMKCKSGKLSEIWINLNGKGNSFKELLSNARNNHSKCLNAYITPGRGGAKSFLRKLFR